MEVWDPVGVVPRLVRANVFPLVLFGFLLFLWLLSGGIVKVSQLPLCPGCARRESYSPWACAIADATRPCSARFFVFSHAACVAAASPDSYLARTTR